MRLYLFWITLVVVFMGCGTTSNSTNDAMDNNFTILKGTVPGTLIESFCDDGSYYYTHSLQNGSNQHPFSLSIPQQLNCRLVMSTNEENISTKVITPIRIVTSEGNNTVFQGLVATVDMGYIPLALDRSDIIDANGDGVSDVNLEVFEYAGGLKVVVLQNDPLDDDGDGIINIYEDDDNDTINNHDDDDDDNDGIKDEFDPDHHDGLKESESEDLEHADEEDDKHSDEEDSEHADEEDEEDDKHSDEEDDKHSDKED